MRHTPRATLVALVLSCGAPAILVAQAPAAGPPPGPNPVTQAFGGVADAFGRRLVAAFDSIPAGRYDYRPTPPQQSVGYIAQHLEDANYVLCEALGGARRSPGPKDALPDTVKARWPKDTLVARLRTSLDFCRDAFARVRDAGLADSVPLGRPGATRPMLRARALALFVTDLAEHHAQLASYMRVMGMVPPSAQPRPPARAGG